MHFLARVSSAIQPLRFRLPCSLASLIALLCLLATAATAAPTAPVAYWTFDNDNANDSVGTHHGTITGPGVSFVAGKVGRAISFASGTSYVKVPSFNLPYLTVSAWVNSSKYGYYTSMVTKNYYTTGWNSPYTAWQLWFSENTAQPAANGASIGSSASPDAVPMNQWFHMATTYDGTTAKVYVNGVLKSSSSVPTPGPLPDTLGDIYIGYPEFSNHSFTGLIDEVALWDRALSAAEIEAQYQNGIGGLGYLAQDSGAPTTPTGLIAGSSAATQMSLSWTASSDDVGVTQYKIYRGGTLLTTLSGTPPATSYTDTGLSASTSYSYTVQACDAAGNCSAQSAASTSVTASAASFTPYSSDANTVLLDHFDGATGASILAYSETGAACGSPKASATPISAYVTGPGGLNQALSLNAPTGQPAGSGSYLQYPGGQLLSQSNGTIEFWTYLTAYGAGVALVNQGPYPGACSGWTFSMNVTSTGQLSAGAWDAFSLSSGATTVPLNTWTHMAASWGSTGAKLYINGALVGTDTNTGMPASGYGGTVLLGYSATNLKIDELRVSNMQRTSFPTVQVSPQFVSAAYYGGAGDQHGTGVSVGNGSIYLTGNSMPETSLAGAAAFVASYAIPPAAAPVWARSWAYGNLFGLTQTSNGVYTAGNSYTLTTDNVGGKETKGIVAKFALDGTDGTESGGAASTIKPNFFSYTGSEWLSAAQAAVEGANTYLYVAGGGQPCSWNAYIVAKYDTAGTLIASATDSSVGISFNQCFTPSSGGSNAMSLTVLNGNVYAAGGSSWTSESDVGGRAAIWKYNSALALQWRAKDTTINGQYNAITSLGNALYAVGYKVTVTSGAVVADSEDYLIEKYDEAGNLLWRQTSGGASKDVLTGVVGIGTRLFAVGYTHSQGAGGADAVVLEIDPSTGSTLSTTLYGGAQDDLAKGAATDGADLYVVGESKSFASAAGNVVGQNDIMLLRYVLQAGPGGAGTTTTTTSTTTTSLPATTTTTTSAPTTTTTTTTAAPTTTTTTTALVTTTTLAPTVPGAPAITGATPGNASVTVSFTAPGSNGGAAITGYTVTSNPAAGADSNAGTTGTSHVITGLTNGTAYTFTVAATNSAGTGPASAASNPVTPATVPGAPTGIGAAAGDAQATVSFAPPSNNGGAAITLYTVTSSPGGFVAAGSSSPIVVTGLFNGVSYTFTVTATNSAGTSASSAASNSVTPSVPSTTTTTTAASTTTTTTAAATTTTTSTSTTTSAPSTTTSTTASTTTSTSSTTTTTTVAGFNLIRGWNLVGNGIEASIDVASTFGDAANVTTVWKWAISGSAAGINYPGWAFYSPSLADGGRAYAATKGYELLTTIKAGEGFWINASAAFTAMLPTGTAINSSRFIPGTGTHALQSGWNLIATGDSPTASGFNSGLSITPPTAGTTPDNLITLWAWDATRAGWYFWAPSKVNSGTLASYLTSKGYLDFSTMPTTPTGTLSPTTGFWVNAP